MKLATIAPYIMRWSVYRFLRLSLGNILTPIITFAIVSKKAKNIVKKLGVENRPSSVVGCIDRDNKISQRKHFKHQP